MNNKFYQDCANILSDIQNSKTTLKNEVYKKPNPKKYMAILSQIIKFKEEYEEIIKKLNYKTKNPFLSLIYVHEILNGNIESKNSLTKSIMKLGAGIDRQKSKKIFYIRLNRNSTFDLNDMTDSLSLEDTFIPDVYKTSINITTSKAFKEGKILIQNISSCLPAYYLSPPINSKVIDCCAAPGNKTSQLSMIMENTGSITAYEKDSTRFLLLRGNIARYNCINTNPINMDFLDSDIDTDAEYILVDPSCSGSGIHDLYEKNEERIKKLSLFQKKILMHAMRHSKAKYISYSTCSIHHEENEEVVEYALENNKKFALKKLKILDQLIMKRGNDKYECSKNVIRIEKNREENIHGFFVAVFVKK